MVAIYFSVGEQRVQLTNIEYSTEAFRNVLDTLDTLHDIEDFASLCLFCSSESFKS